MDFDPPAEDDQRDIMGEQVLGLPRQPDAEAGLLWAETRSRRQDG